MKRTFRSDIETIRYLAVLENLFWYRYCKRGLFFYPICWQIRYLASFFSMAATTTFKHVSTCQGNPHSLLCRRVSANRLSILDRLTARSVTGQGLQILVHQHYAYRLHLEWRGRGSRVSSRFMERRFLMSRETETFCTELCSYGLEGLCTCVYEGYYMSKLVRARRCLRKPLMLSQEYLLKPTWWLKAKQDTSDGTHCGCCILSSYRLE
jgi:hypothetical protein